MWQDAQATPAPSPVVTAMRGGLVGVGRVTLQADAVPRRAQLGAVRIVAIAAGDAGREHPALLEGAVVVDLFDVRICPSAW